MAFALPPNSFWLRRACAPHNTTFANADPCSAPTRIHSPYTSRASPARLITLSSTPAPSALDREDSTFREQGDVFNASPRSLNERAQEDATFQSLDKAIRQGFRVLGLSAAATIAALSTSNLPGLMVPNRGGLGRLVTTAANATAKYSKKTLSEKLSQVPVFAVTNASGQPYLANMDGSGSQVGLIFFSHLDALNMLKDMQKNPGASDARVYIMGLDKAYEMVKAKPTPSGIRSSSGEELTMVFRFFPDSRQVKAAEGLARKLRLRSSVDGVPVFVAKGLTLRKGSENVVPLFLTKEDLDAAWSKLRATNKDLPGSAQVYVGNLLYIIQQMENGESPEMMQMGFFAPKASVEYVAKEQAGPSGQARMHQNPVGQQQK